MGLRNTKFIFAFLAITNIAFSSEESGQKRTPEELIVLRCENSFGPNRKIFYPIVYPFLAPRIKEFNRNAVRSASVERMGTTRRLTPDVARDSLDFEELSNFFTSAGRVDYEREKSDNNFEIARARFFEFFNSERSLIHIANHSSSISVIGRNAIALAAEFRDNGIKLTDLKSEILDVLRRAQAYGPEGQFAPLTPRDLQYLGMPMGVNDRVIPRFQQFINYISAANLVDLIPEIADFVPFLLEHPAAEFQAIYDQIKFFSTQDANSISDQEMVARILDIDRSISEAIVEAIEKDPSSVNLAPLPLTAPDRFSLRTPPKIVEEKPVTNSGYSTCIAGLARIFVDLIVAKQNFALVERLVKLLAHPDTVSSGFLVRVASNALDELGRQRKLNDAGQIHGLAEPLSLALKIFKEQGFLPVFDFELIFSEDAYNHPDFKKASGPVFYAASILTSTYNLTFDNLLPETEWDLLRPYIPLRVFHSDIGVFNRTSELKAAADFISSDGLSFKNFGRVLNIVAGFLTTNRYFSEPRSEKQADSGEMHSLNEIPVLRSATLMMEFIEIMRGSEKVYEAFKKVEKELFTRASHFKAQGTNNSFSYEEIGLLYIYLALHPDPLVACEFLSSTVQNDFGNLLVQIRMYAAGFERMLNYSTEQLMAGKVTSLMRSFTPWKTKDYEGHGSLVEELLSRFGQKWADDGKPDNLDPWGRAFYDLVEAQKLTSSLLTIVEGNTPATPEVALIAAKILRLYSQKYGGYPSVGRRLGTVGKKKKSAKAVSLEDDQADSAQIDEPIVQVIKLSPFEVVLDKFISGKKLEDKERRLLLNEVVQADIAKIIGVFDELSISGDQERRSLILKVLGLKVHQIFVDHRHNIRQHIPVLLRNLSLNEIASLQLNNTTRNFVSTFTKRKKKVVYAVELLFDTNLEARQTNRELYFQILNLKIESETLELKDDTREFLCQFLISLTETDRSSVRPLEMFLKSLSKDMISEQFFSEQMSQFLRVPSRSLFDEEIRFFVQSEQMLRSDKFSHLEWTLAELGWGHHAGQESMELNRAVRKDRRLKAYDLHRRQLFETFSAETGYVDSQQRRELTSTSDVKGMRVVELFARSHHLLLQNVSDVYKMGYDFILVDPVSDTRHNVELKTSSGENNTVHLSPNQVKVSASHRARLASGKGSVFSVLVVKAGGFAEGGIKELIWVKNPDLESIVGAAETIHEDVTVSLSQLKRSADWVEIFNLR